MFFSLQRRRIWTGSFSGGSKGIATSDDGKERRGWQVPVPMLTSRWPCPIKSSKPIVPGPTLTKQPPLCSPSTINKLTSTPSSEQTRPSSSGNSYCRPLPYEPRDNPPIQRLRRKPKNNVDLSPCELRRLRHLVAHLPLLPRVLRRHSRRRRARLSPPLLRPQDRPRTFPSSQSPPHSPRHACKSGY